MLLLCVQLASAAVLPEQPSVGWASAPASLPYSLEGAPSSFTMSSDLPLASGGAADPLLHARYLRQSQTATTGLMLFGVGSVVLLAGVVGVVWNFLTSDQSGLTTSVGAILIGGTAATVGEVMLHVGAIGAAGTLQQMGRGRGPGLGWAGVALRGTGLLLSLSVSGLGVNGTDVTVLSTASSLASVSGLVVSGMNYGQVMSGGSDLRVAVSPVALPSLAANGAATPGLVAVVVW